MGVGDAVFGVAHTNRVSRVYEISVGDALKFLQVRGVSHERVLTSAIVW